MTGARSVFARDDTLFGACHALGEDFGFNPTWLRALFALGLFLSPAAAVAGYAACAALVAVARWLVPDPSPAPTEPEAAPANEDERQAQAWEELAAAA